MVLLGSLFCMLSVFSWDVNCIRGAREEWMTSYDMWANIKVSGS